MGMLDEEKDLLGLSEAKKQKLRTLVKLRKAKSCARRLGGQA
jgi:hypothetical protein